MDDLTTPYDDDSAMEFIECSVCEISLRGQNLYKIHLTMPGHLKKEEAAVAAGLAVRERTVPKFKDILQCVDYLKLDEPIIGLNFLEEVGSVNADHPSLGPRYTCTLCNITAYSPEMVHHVIGRKHRHKYIKTKRPDLVNWDKDMVVNQVGKLLRTKAELIAKEDGSGRPMPMKRMNAGNFMSRVPPWQGQNRHAQNYSGRNRRNQDFQGPHRSSLRPDSPSRVPFHNAEGPSMHAAGDGPTANLWDQHLDRAEDWETGPFRGRNSDLDLRPGDHYNPSKKTQWGLDQSPEGYPAHRNQETEMEFFSEDGMTDYQPEGRDHQPEGRDYQPEGRDYQPEGRDYQPEGRDYQPEGRDYQPEGRDYKPPGRDYQPEGRDYQPEGRDYQPVGRDYQPPGRDYQPPGRDYQPPGRRDTQPQGRNSHPHRTDYMTRRPDSHPHLPGSQPQHPDSQLHRWDFQPQRPDSQPQRPGYQREDQNWSSEKDRDVRPRSNVPEPPMRNPRSSLGKPAPVFRDYRHGMQQDEPLPAGPNNFKTPRGDSQNISPIPEPFRRFMDGPVGGKVPSRVKRKSRFSDATAEEVEVANKMFNAGPPDSKFATQSSGGETFHQGFRGTVRHPNRFSQSQLNSPTPPQMSPQQPYGRKFQEDSNFGRAEDFYSDKGNRGGRGRSQQVYQQQGLREPSDSIRKRYEEGFGQPPTYPTRRPDDRAQRPGRFQGGGRQQQQQNFQPRDMPQPPSQGFFPSRSPPFDTERPVAMHQRPQYSKSLEKLTSTLLEYMSRN